jgi:hypothetical protein
MDQGGAIVATAQVSRAIGSVATRALAKRAAAQSPGKLATTELNPTHRVKVRYGSAKAEFEALKADIKANGIKEPIKYVEHGGRKYIVDGHHRLRAAQELGIREVPVQKVEPPYGGYRTPDDLIDFFNNPG